MTLLRFLCWFGWHRRGVSFGVQPPTYREVVHCPRCRRPFFAD